MKIIDRAIYVIFSIIVLIMSMLVCLLIFGWIKIPTITLIIEKILNNGISIKVALGTALVLILLAVKGIFFTDTDKTDKANTEGILLENEDGKLLISKNTIENLVSGVVKGFESIENVTTKVRIDNENNIIVYIDLQVASNAIIKDLSLNMQSRIKEAIKNSSDLEVKEVNIQIKNITYSKESAQE